ncbi:MAG: histidine--tRNA ligase [Syntrophomonadaceae bacterium]|nr:histidine--tRNA ligase [Syntrophomonadaceae bacterium]
MPIKAPRGTYDIMPPVSRSWQVLEERLKEVARLYGYQEIRTPLFEYTELFERGVGEGTDIVSKEMYTFYDKSGRSLTLRPEMTASCARALIEHSAHTGLLPIKWFYYGPMFRYDRPQSGRYRQFHQFGVEVFGSASPMVDAEVLMMMVQMLKAIGLKEYRLHLNSVGCPSCRDSYRQALLDHIKPFCKELCPDCQQRYQQNPLRVLDCKNPGCHQAITGYPRLLDHLCADCARHYQRVQETLKGHGISFLHDDQLVRGLDYYTNTAFEIHIPGIGAQSAVGGGGRYNGLVKAIDGPDLPGIGFALGLERLLLAMQQNHTLNQHRNGIEVFVAVMEAQYEDIAISILQELRAAGIAADKDYMDRKARAQMKYADKLGAPLVLLVGDEEVKAGFVTVRNMTSKRQVAISRADLIPGIKNLLQQNEEEQA